jgi:UDP-glucose 4-epimerase
MKNILITGVAGFLGRYMARHFVGLGDNVVGIDTAPPENAPLASLSHYYSLHLPDPGLIDILKQHYFQLCIHCAGRASVPFSIENPAADFLLGPVLTFELLNAMRLQAPE